MLKITELAAFTEFQGRPLEITLTGVAPSYSRTVTYAGHHIGWISFLASQRRKGLQPDGSRSFVTTFCYWHSSFDLNGKRPSGKNTPVEEAIAEMVKAAETLLGQLGQTWSG
jgi:hypothetical protein